MAIHGRTKTPVFDYSEAISCTNSSDACVEEKKRSLRHCLKEEKLSHPRRRAHEKVKRSSLLSEKFWTARQSNVLVGEASNIIEC